MADSVAKQEIKALANALRDRGFTDLALEFADIADEYSVQRITELFEILQGFGL